MSCSLQPIVRFWSPGSDSFKPRSLALSSSSTPGCYSCSTLLSSSFSFLVSPRGMSRPPWGRTRPPWKQSRPQGCLQKMESSALPAISGSKVNSWGSNSSSPRSSASCGWSRLPTSAGTWFVSCCPRRLRWRSSWTSTTRAWRTRTTPRLRPSLLWPPSVNTLKIIFFCFHIKP